MTSPQTGGDKREPATPSQWFHRRDYVIPLVLVLFAVAFNLYHLYPEVAGGVLDGNDMALHRLLTEAAVEAITRGQDFTDPWQGSMSMGFPLSHYYQHLPHVTIAFVHVMTLGVFSLTDLLHWSTYLLLSLFPISIFWSLRHLGFDQISSAMGGLVAPLVATNGLYGFDFRSYVFSGWGLYTQLWGMVLFPPTLAVSYRVLREGRGYFWATLLLASTLMSHLIYGYMAFLTLGILTLIQPIQISNPMSLAGTLLRSWRRLIILFLLVVVVTSYFLVPFFLDLEYFNRSVWTDPRKFNSYGHSVLVSSLVSGQLFDGVNRIPSLTYLVFLGFIVCLFRWRNERYLIPIAIFLLWLMLYFGRETWGSLIDLLPFSRDIHMHRFIGGVHLGGIFLIAVALAGPLRWAISRSSIWSGWYVTMALSLTMLVLLPIYSERMSYLKANALGLRESRQGLGVDAQDLSALLEKLKQLPPGRVYAGQKMPGGRRQNWGYDYYVGHMRLYALLQTRGLDMVNSVYHPYSLNSDVLIDFDERRWDHYNIYNARYVVAPEGQRFPPFVQPLQQFGRHRLYQVDTTGYFDLVGSDLAFTGRKTDLYPAASSWLASGLPGVKQHPMVSLGNPSQAIDRQIALSEAADVIANAHASAGPIRGVVLSEEIGNNFFEAKVSVERESMLLLKTTYHPNWRATVDGVEANTVMLMPSFVGVRLLPGDHDVRIEYRPRKLRMILLALGLITLLLIAIGEKRGIALSNWFATSVLARIPKSVRRPGRTDGGQDRRRRMRR